MKYIADLCIECFELLVKRSKSTNDMLALIRARSSRYMMLSTIIEIVLSR